MKNKNIKGYALIVMYDINGVFFLCPRANVLKALLNGASFYKVSIHG